jgi:hypothetical protein
VMQLSVRSRPIGDREVVVLGGRRIGMPGHFRRLTGHGLRCGLMIFPALVRSGRYRLGIPLRRICNLRDLEPYASDGGRGGEI